MKQFLLGLFLFCTFNSFSQTVFDSVIYNDKGDVFIENIIEVKGAKDSLFNKAKLWINSLFKDPRYAVISQDKDLGLVSLQTNIDYYHPYLFEEKKKGVQEINRGLPTNLKFNMKIYTKDDKIKLVFDEMSTKTFFAEGYVEMDKQHIEAIRNFQIKKPKDEVDKGNYERALRGAIGTLSELQNKLVVYLNKKAENDF